MAISTVEKMGPNGALPGTGPESSGRPTKRTFEQYTGDQWHEEVNTLFNPEDHLAFKEAPATHSMESIGIPDSGISPVAVSEPFPLFTEEAVNIMREEVLADAVQSKYAWTSDIAPKQLRGYCPDYAKFVYEAWKHPKTLEIISKIAGIDLVPQIDYEIGHVNLSVPGVRNNHKVLSEDDKDAIVGWHKDSYPFVCVLMMSDTSEMVGGETALKTSSGKIMKVRGPQKGCAVVLQGRYIEHQALRAFGGQERITMVTSFRPKSPFVRDDTVLNTVRPISSLADLYGQTMEYQLENMEARVRYMLKKVREDQRSGRVNVKAIKQFLSFETRQLSHIDKEIVEESDVVRGSIAEMIAAERAADALLKSPVA